MTTITTHRSRRSSLARVATAVVAAPAVAPQVAAADTDTAAAAAAPSLAGAVPRPGVSFSLSAVGARDYHRFSVTAHVGGLAAATAAYIRTRQRPRALTGAR